MVSLVSAARHRIYYIVSHLTEKIHGVDFTLPDRMYDRNRHDGAMYYATPEKMLWNILSSIDTKRFDRFFDVGCGKGYVLKAAADFGFRKVGGLEYDERLAGICAKNLNRTGLSKQVSLNLCDAASFRGYGQYNCFYFYNPFMEPVMEEVIGKICSECRGREILLIYYHPRYCRVIERSGFFRKVNIFYDRERDYEVFIYQGIPGVMQNGYFASDRDRLEFHNASCFG